ncbi:Helicase conserved C-terminal domain-containing protein [Alteribacillus persepolensis]|uniref:Helicase conserved C-terminal domain-containing protein n=1 Tax=Alteribacillus persepolensis TaxID=568899 RepID=A0A1G8CXH1_9BACI|nr:SNF2-related protein [Alteribacillus persepolensis]SDH50277.1 Helicase conserved C-terminal domain-containing protein [Alteribacillus persepolensis]
MEIDINFLSDWEIKDNKNYENRSISSWEQFCLAYESEQYTSSPSFDGLLCQHHLPNLTLYDHQEKTAKRVIEEMDGKAILADEVGLGKTIEAGLILKEYMVRGLVKKVLILAPASLTGQWAKELNEKFYIPAVTQRKTYVWEEADIVVASIDTAKRPPHREIVLNQQYDMIIFDEAHKLKNPKTKNYAFARQLQKKFCLMLTATPVQNNPGELYHLINLLKPGLLGSMDEFKTLFKEEGQEAVKHIVQKVMVRNRRDQTGLKWTKRNVHSTYVHFTPEEQVFYDTLFDLKNDPKNMIHGFTATTLLREACSSKEAAYMTLQNLYERKDISQATFEHLVSCIQSMAVNSKAEQALDIINATDEKVVVFTEYRATQLFLQWYLQQHGITSVPFRGGFKRSKKEWMQQLFKNRAKVMIATEAAGEGINLQFSSTIINYDLPWNPMRLEQRIGRLHRLGQTRDVEVYNFAVKNTVEEHILSLLYEKIKLFENVIGELDEILSKTAYSSLEGYITDALHTSDSEQEIALKLHHLSAIMEETNEKEGG